MSARVEHLAEGVTVYCGDCREILPTLGRFDAVVTDPPYGLGAKLNGGTWGASTDMKVWDATTADDVVAQLRTMADRIVVWGGNYYTLPSSRCWLAWHKPDAPPSMADFELAWTNLDANAQLISVTIAATDAERVGHPTQKPLAVMKWTLVQIPQARSILDPFMGSGTTGVAAVKLGRKFTGIEREPRYFDIACRRISDALKQPDMFIEKPSPLKQTVML